MSIKISRTSVAAARPTANRAGSGNGIRGAFICRTIGFFNTVLRGAVLVVEGSKRSADLERFMRGPTHPRIN
jgi:hypothetical protein